MGVFLSSNNYENGSLLLLKFPKHEVEKDILYLYETSQMVLPLYREQQQINSEAPLKNRPIVTTQRIQLKEIYGT